MKPAPFAYHRAESLAHALELLAQLGDGAKVLAGGQSLVAMMNFRLVRPAALIDVMRVPGLSYILQDNGALRVGALTRHRDVERYPAPLDGFRVLPRAARWVGHVPIRTRGTFGGSIAHGDPASEWCILASLLDAEIVVAGPRGRRVIGVGDFFDGFLSTALEPDELLVEVRFPRPFGHSALQEFARRHGDFAIVAAAVAFDVAEGIVRNARVALGGVAATVRRVPEAEAELEGAEPSQERFAAAARAAAAAVDPPGDIHGSSQYRKDLTAVMVGRALDEAMITHD